MGGLIEGTYTTDLRAAWENVKMVTQKTRRDLGMINVHAQFEFPHDCRGGGFLSFLLLTSVLRKALNIRSYNIVLIPRHFLWLSGSSCGVSSRKWDWVPEPRGGMSGGLRYFTRMMPCNRKAEVFLIFNGVGEGGHGFRDRGK